jgi:hypothetical protein
VTGNSDDEANAVAVDPNDNVFVAGYIRAADNTHQFHTRKYNSAGTLQWQQSFSGDEGDFLRGAIGVVADAEGNAFVTGSSTVDNFTTTIYTAKYASAMVPCFGKSVRRLRMITIARRALPLIPAVTQSSQARPMPKTKAGPITTR